jgi:NAD(P)-dependent dehydrogenase (short-subunit alcohol dehydrogenase family)
MAHTLDGKVVAITGGARGIGAAMARAFHAAGATVAIGDIDADAVATTAAEIGFDVMGRRLDVTDHADFTGFLNYVELTLGSIDVLINNAGIMPVTAFEKESAESTERQIAINLAAVIHGTREAVRRMVPRRSGHIVNVASAAGLIGFPYITTYCATKFGVVGLTEALRGELHGTGVSASLVMPGVVRTELAAGLPDYRPVPAVTPEQIAAAVVRVVQRGRGDVCLPARLKGVHRVVRLLPTGWGAWLLRVIKADQLMASAVHSPERSTYNARIHQPA